MHFCGQWTGERQAGSRMPVAGILAVYEKQGFNQQTLISYKADTWRFAYGFLLRGAEKLKAIINSKGPPMDPCGFHRRAFFLFGLVEVDCDYHDL